MKRVEGQHKFDDIDDNKVTSFLEKAKSWSEKTDSSFQFNPSDFIRNEFFKDQDEKKGEELKGLVKEAFSLSLDDLQKSREDEGEKMVAVINSHREQYHSFFQQVISLREHLLILT